MNSILPQTLLRLLQLTSQSLPVGAFAFSQGLESAVDAGFITSEHELADWLGAQLENCVARVDLPLLSRIMVAVGSNDREAELAWSQRLIAMRETRELRLDDVQRGYALRRLLVDLGELEPAELTTGEWPFARAFAHAADAWEIPPESALPAFAWAWSENQVLAGVKLVPLGQTAGQRLLGQLSGPVVAACETALSLRDEELGGSMPLLSILSSQHETQYSRLFRS